jgi:uncharacterized protein YggE
MNIEKSKTILFSILSIFILVLGYGVLSYVNTYSKTVEPSAYRSFSVSAEGKAIGVPDIAQFNFSIISEGEDVSKIQKENTENANKAIEFLKNQGIDSKDIKTEYYNLSPKYTYYDCSNTVIYSQPNMEINSSLKPEPKPCPPPKITGYIITQTISVKIRDFSKIGSILSGIAQYNVKNISNLDFSIDNQTQLENQAREEAISKAKEKAKNIAKAAGFKLGKLLSIEEGNYYPYYRASTLGMGGGTEKSIAAPQPPQIEPGSQEIKINITLTYEIE